MEAVCLASITREAVQNALSSWEGNVEVHVDDNTLVQADREKLYRTLVNGIRNASEAIGQDGPYGYHPPLTAVGSSCASRIQDRGFPRKALPGFSRLFSRRKLTARVWDLLMPKR